MCILKLINIHASVCVCMCVYVRAYVYIIYTSHEIKSDNTTTWLLVVLFCYNISF